MNVLIPAVLFLLPLPAAPSPSGVPAIAAPLRDGCTLGPRFPVGRKLVYAFTSSTTNRAGAADSPETTYTVDLLIRLAVLGSDEHGGASLSLLFDRVKITESAPAPDQPAAEAAYTRREAEEAEELADDAPAIKRVARTLAKAAVRLDVDHAGIVTTVSGLEDAQAAANAAGPMGGYLLGPLAANADRRTLSMLFRIDTPTDDGAFPTRQQSDTWTLVDRVPMGAIAQLVLTAALTLDSCTPQEARVTGSVKTTAAPPTGDDGEDLPDDPGRPRIEVRDANDTLSIIWDPSKGLLRKRERSGAISILAKLGAVRQNLQNLRTRSTIELIEVSDDAP